MEGIKPGTRCECRGDHGMYLVNDQGNLIEDPLTDPQCSHNAIRIVTFYRWVQTSEPYGYAQGIGSMPDTRKETKRVPMCAACADWHEKASK